MLRRGEIKKDQNPRSEAQATVEFTFCMIVVFIMMFSLFRVFRWSGEDMVERRIKHEQILKNDKVASGIDPRRHTYRQLSTNFYKPIPLNAAWSYTTW